MNKPLISLRTAIALPFIVLFSLTVALQALLQQYSTLRLIEEDSSQLLKHMTTTVSLRLDNFFMRPMAAQRMVVDGIARHGLYGKGELKSIQAYLRGTFETLYAEDSQISAIGFGSALGEYVGYRRAPADGRQELIDLVKSDSNELRLYSADKELVPRSGASGHDPRSRPWYRKAVELRKPGWSDIYLNQDERLHMGMAYMGPLIQHNQLQGVVATEVTLDGISQHLRNSRGHASELIIVVDARGHIVAHSEPGNVTTPSSVLRSTLSESVNPIIRAAAEPVNSMPAQMGGEFRFKYADQKFFGRTMPYLNQTGLDWRIVAILPEAALLNEARKTQVAAILLATVLGATGIVIGLLAISRVTKPILRAAEAASKISLGHPCDLKQEDHSVRETAILITAFSEMALRLQKSFDRLRQSVLVDELTGLSTRSGLFEQINWTEPRRCILFLIGIDDFRALNDIMGFETGGQILRAIAERLKALPTPPAWIARTGGDEFALVFEVENNETDVDMTGRQLLAAFDQPFEINREMLVVRASISAVTGALTAELLTEWLRRGSAALGEAKSLQKKTCVVFSDEILNATIAKRQLINDIQRATNQSEFIAYYQPIVDLKTGKVEGLEALIRWLHPQRGIVPPADFLHVAEESDLIVCLGARMLEQSCRDIKHLKVESGRWFNVHVNISARQLLQSNFLEFVQATLRRNDVPPQYLTIEVTESVFINADDGPALYTLQGLKAIGVSIAIDDFGTGYSSLAYLERLPIDCLKIDRSFIENVVHVSARSALLANAIIDVAQKLKLNSVAEGVEQLEQVRTLREMGCQYGQGYYFSPPVPRALLDLSPRIVA